MATAASQNFPKPQAAITEPRWLRILLITITVLFLAFFLFVPLAAIFTEALRKGIGAYFKSFNRLTAHLDLKLTLLVTGISVPLNLVFGLAASWALAKFQFWGRSVLITLIDLPYTHFPRPG